jgi:hypothetical protein
MPEKAMDIQTDPQAMSLHPPCLWFHDNAFARQFHSSWLRATSRINRIWVACGIGFYIFYTVLLLMLLTA